MVVCLHVSPTLFEHYPSIAGISIIHGLRSIFMLGVTIFAFITGYYGAKWSSKFYSYYFIVLFYGIVFCSLDIWVNGLSSPEHYIEFLFPISGNGCWYASSYLLLLLLHRFIPLEDLDKYPNVERKVIFFFLLVCYGAQFLLGVDGTTVLMLIEIYIIGRYMRTRPNNFIEKNALSIFCFSLALLVGSFIIVSYIDTLKGLDEKLINRFTNNRNPLLLVTSVSLFYLAKSKVFQSKIISYLATHTLTIYVIHAFAKHSVINYSNYSNIHWPITSFLLSVVFTMILCIIIEVIRRKLCDAKVLSIIKTL